MPAYQTRTSQFGLVSGIQQAASDLIVSVEPGTLFAPEARKGQLHLLVEAGSEAPKGHEACQLAIRTLRKVFYEDSSFSLTSALRDSLRMANKALYQHNFGVSPQQRASVGLSCAVLRGDDLYVAQIAPCQAYILNNGKIRALPSHLPVASQNATAAVRLGALGTSLSVEPELYRFNVRPGDALLLCSSSMARMLPRDDIERALRYQDPSAAVESLLTLCRQNGLSEAHAFALECMPPLSPAARNAPLSPTGLGERASLALRSVGDWFAGFTGEAVLATRKQRRRQEAAPDEPELTHPEGLMVDPTPLPRPIELGESLGERTERQHTPEAMLEQRHQQEHHQRRQRRLRPATASIDESMQQPPSSFLGEEGYIGIRHRRVDLPDETARSTVPNPFRPQHEMRPIIDMTWGERLMLPFQRLNESLSHGVSIRSPRNRSSLRTQSQQSMPPVRGKGLSYRRQSPPFPWLRLALLVLLVTVLILYGVNLSRTRADQDMADYLSQAEQRMASVRAASDDGTATERLDQAREAIDQVRASPLVTVTNLDLWPRYQELEREYERAQAALQRLTYLEDAKVLATHPLPNGRFSALVLPPSGLNITDTTPLRYVYALDSGKESGQLYRIPLAGGPPETFLKSGDAIANAVAGPIRALAWREDNIVAVDQGPNNTFSYFFRSGGAWALSQLAGSELWSPKERLDIEAYDGNLYVWGGEQGQLLKYTSGHYADLPVPWIVPDKLNGRDVSSAVDMAVDGSVYLLQPNGTVEVLSAGAFDHEVVPEAVTPPITAVTRFYVTGTADAGFIFLIDALNERIIQIDKISGKVIQQIRTRPDDPVRLDQLTDIVVDASSRPVLYIVNGAQIVRAELPAPPRPLRSTVSTPGATPVATPIATPIATPSQ